MSTLDLSLTFISSVGRKRTVYLPKQVCEGIGVGEGDCVLMRVERLRSGGERGRQRCEADDGQSQPAVTLSI